MPENSSSRAPRPGPNRAGSDRRRSLSQNFLTDPSVARRLVRLAGLPPSQPVLEVGGGDGMITRALAPATRCLTVYEIDRTLADRLAARYRRTSGVRVVHGDFLRATPPSTSFTVVGSIPYALTTPILDWCLNAPHLATAALITQSEYARKRTGDYGRWTRTAVQTWPEFEWVMAARVPKDRFRPVPRVDSAILLLRRRTAPLLPAGHGSAYRRFVAAGFTGVGGSLRASLRAHYPRRTVDRALDVSEVEGSCVVGFVSPDEWCALYKAFTFTL